MAELLQPFAGPDAAGLAVRLIDQFGSLGAALQAPYDALGKMPAEDLLVLEKLRAARQLADYAAREHLVRSRVSTQDREFLAYLRRLLAPHPGERLHVTFTDRAGGFIADELVCEGVVSAVELRGRDIVTRALQLGAHGIILAHNHPSGSEKPSPADVAATRNLEAILSALDIHLSDHLIVTRTSVTSMRDGGFL